MNFWQELRRRRVYRMAGLYIVGAWVVIQVAEVSFEAWGLPDTALRYLFIAAVLCFPIAVIFSWFYDITPKGIIRTEPAGATEKVELKLKRADYGVLAALLAVGLAILFGSVGKIQQEIESAPVAEPETTTARRENSIAVLPFANLDPNPDTDYFSDGITEEIGQRLSMLGKLHVLGTVSSFAFRNSQEGPASIIEKLGVRYLLRGSVRRDNDYVRITANLLDEQGFQVWSQSFDRKLESIFIIQAEIASLVSGQIVNEIVPMQELPAGRTTANTKAYTEYLLGKSLLDARSDDWVNKATEAFGNAIELDEGYAPPYAGLAIVGYFSGATMEECLELAEKSLQLDPELPIGLAALGLVQGYLGQLQLADASLRRSIELDPSLSIGYNWLALNLREQGLMDEADMVHKQGLEVEPLDPMLVLNVIDIESRDRNFERAEQLALRLTKLPQPSWFTYKTLGDLYSKWGRYDKEISAAKDVARHRGYLENLARTYPSLGMIENSSYWSEQARSRYPVGTQVITAIHTTYEIARKSGDNSQLEADLDYLDEQRVFEAGNVPDYVLVGVGIACIQAGRYQDGIDHFIQAHIQEHGGEQVDYAEHGYDITRLSEEMPPWFVIFPAQRLAFAFQQTGRPDIANRLLQDIDDVYWPGGMPEKGEPSMLEYFALNRGLSGNNEDALLALQQAADMGWAGYYEIANDPVWAETLKAPGFKALLDDLKAANDRQRANVEAIEAEHDFRAEVEALMLRQ
jgi:TolB-like protein/tetratricopeptide (TPR) repeat protein